MKPEFKSRRLFGITRSKGKMYELGLPEDFHIEIPEGRDPHQLFLLTVGALGDAAAAYCEADDLDAPLPRSTAEGLEFAASFFDAFLASRFSTELARDTTLLAAAAYYLARRPGSSLVLARRLTLREDSPPIERLLKSLLLARWKGFRIEVDPWFGDTPRSIASLLERYFHDGSGENELRAALGALRRKAYEGASPRELLFADLIVAIARMRLAVSAWATLPTFTGIDSESWSPAIRRSYFPKELWPSQILLGKSGLFSGRSGVIQMPTSAGKTKALEIILRSGFLSGRATLAVVVAPFRALCHEIGTTLRIAFKQDNVKVNELSDAFQLDYMQHIIELLGSDIPISKCILVLTPEKLLYVLRQTPSLAPNIGIVVYDEGHQFDSGERGITYELLLTELKPLLPDGAQTVLISAVIQNARAIGEWLIGDNVQVVNGSGLLPTSRSIAFASWIERLGQLMFFESESFGAPSYFVPRVIEQQTLTKRESEKKDRVFPGKGDSKDIALYLGIRLASQGAVAVFCGRKDSASSIASKAVNIYERNFSLPAPAEFSDVDELQRMKYLVDEYFGNRSVLSRAASLGVFVHHGATPHGLRLSIEHAMQQGRIKFVACTSTLAQGVNLPIRYLIVTSIRQARDEIKVRDFQNLIGRAGRSGMHTEGLVIFSDPKIFDQRKSERSVFDSSTKLLSPEQSELTTSSLLGVLSPLYGKFRHNPLAIFPNELGKLIMSTEDEWYIWANQIERSRPGGGFTVDILVREIKNRRRMIYAVESHLMANRGNRSFVEFRGSAEQLAKATLAHQLASGDVKIAIQNLFTSVAEYVNQLEPDAEKQRTYAKTLLGVRSAKAVDAWVDRNGYMLLSLRSNEELLDAIWPLLVDQLDDKFFRTVEPRSLSIELARLWIRGRPYQELFDITLKLSGSKPRGDKRIRLTEDEIIGFCETTLAYECSLIVSAVAQFSIAESENDGPGAEALALFQKGLKYGLPDQLSISCYESGFADRMIAQRLCDISRAKGFSGTQFAPALRAHQPAITAALKRYPSYFESVLAAQR